MIVVDGSAGEGGGQIVRTSLALSLLTGQPFRVEKVRAGRAKPGLRKQHLTAVQAAALLGGARLEGAAVGSTTFSFHPGPIQGGEYDFDIGSAGSAMLVLQTILLPLLRAPKPSRVSLTGGTHNPMAPPFEFVEQTFFPILRGCGAELHIRLLRHGFYPAGGGRVEVNIEPLARLTPLRLLDLGKALAGRACALVVKLPAEVARRQLEVVRQQLGWSDLQVQSCDQAHSPGNMLSLAIPSQGMTEIVTALGEKGVPAEQVALAACQETARYLRIGAPVGEHLADQLLLPMALSGAGEFVTGPLSQHARTNMDTIRLFLPVHFETRQLGPETWKVSLS
ncbi:RNA 3'-terminal phosphate cyclase [bacterium]|nr:RNA 3'-terminal phosphate cyclase [bacterium]